MSTARFWRITSTFALLTVFMTATDVLAKSHYPVTVKNCGRSLTFTKAPSRVITGYEPAFENIVALGLSKRILGRANYSDDEGGFPARIPTRNGIPGVSFKAAYRAARQISPTIKIPEKEKLLQLRPDFVINHNPETFDATQGFATLKELDANHSPGYITGGSCSVGPETDVKIETTLQDLENLGKIFNVERRANALVRRQRKTLRNLRLRLASEPRVRVLAHDGGAGPIFVNGAGLVNEMIHAAGGNNIFGLVKERSLFKASVEQVAASNPDAVLVETGGPNPVPAKLNQVWPLISGSPAERQRRSMVVSAVAEHPGYRTIPAVAAIARFLHPNAFKK